MTVWIVWLLSLAFYFYEFLIRVLPSVLVDPLMRAFSINAEAVGFLGGLFYYAYAPMQLPVGVLFDRFGARRLLALAALLAGIGTFLFGFSPNYEWAVLGRLLTGLGASFAFVGMIYITSREFPRKRIALLIGIANSLGMLGAISGEGPISLAEDPFGWRAVVLILGAIGILIGVAFLFTALRQDPSMRPKGSRGFSSTIKRSFTRVISHPQTWINALISLCFFITTSAFASLWAVPFMQTTHHLTRDTAAFASSMIFAGWMVGGPALGHASDFHGKRRPFLLLFSALGALALLPMIYIPDLPLYVLYVLLFFVGVFSSAQLLTFSLAVKFHPSYATGSAIALTNFTVTLGGAIFQPLVGWLLVHFWSGTSMNGVAVYSVRDFQIAMSCFPLSFALAFVLTLFLREPKK